MLCNRNDTVDPRVRRTRQSLQEALAKLMEEKAFEKVSVQDITEAATLNRATFYDHYPDKFALLKSLVASRFHELINERGITFDGSCSSALRGLVLGVCDYLVKTPGMGREPQCEVEPSMESAIIEVIRQKILDGLNGRRLGQSPSNEMVATMTGWAIYGGAKEWARTPDRGSSEQIVDSVLLLVAPLLGEMSRHSYQQ